MEPGELPKNPNFTPRKEHITTALNFLKDQENKALFVIGRPQTGKTSTVIAALDTFTQEVPDTTPRILYTTPQIHHNFGLKPMADRTGIIYEPLPRLQDLRTDPERPTVLVIDEISIRNPQEGRWEDYINLPNLKAILLTTPGINATPQWRKLFDPAKTVEMYLG